MLLKYYIDHELKLNYVHVYTYNICFLMYKGLEATKKCLNRQLNDNMLLIIKILLRIFNNNFNMYMKYILMLFY